MDWTNKFTVLGIDYNTNDMGEITTTNIEKKISDIKKLIKLWQARKLTGACIGKAGMEWIGQTSSLFLV